MESLINAILVVVGLYILIGIIFAILFVMKGVDKIDEATHGISWGFRLLIFPGSVAFWPVLIKKWRRGNK